MKSKVSILIAVLALIVSFAFITVNKEAQEKKNFVKVEKSEGTPLTGYAAEDEGQWD